MLVPGITGSRLIERSTEKRIWGAARNFFVPRDHGRALALSIQSNRLGGDSVEADGAFTGFRFLGAWIDVYRSLLRSLEANGYQSGDLRDPRPGDTLFVFDYDWRRSNIDSAVALAESLERLRVARGEPTLRVHLIAHSNAARITRWLIKYGAVSLEQAEAGLGLAGTDRIEVEKLILIGSDNGGAMETLHDLLRGRSYVPWIGRRFSTEVLFSFPSIFESLPVYRQDLLIELDGSPAKLDLFDAETWVSEGWSVWDPQVQRRLTRGPRAALFADRAARLAHLRGVLDRAARFHRLLGRDVGDFQDSHYYEIQARHLSTSTRAVVLPRDDGGSRLLFSSDRRVKNDAALFSLAAAVGDGHATRDSQSWISPQKQTALGEPTFWVDAPHRRIVLDPDAQRRIAELLDRPESAPKATAPAVDAMRTVAVGWRHPQ